MTPDDIIQTAKRVIDTEIQGLNLMRDAMGDAFVQAVEV